MFESARRDIQRYTGRGGGRVGDTFLKRCRVVLTTPCLHSVLVYRFGSWVTRNVTFRPLRWPLKAIYACLQCWCSVLWGIDIDPEARIGPGLFIGHHSGILIGPVTMGEDCNIAHQVTIGRRADGSGDVPVIGDRVWIGVGSVVFGRIRIGSGTTIGPLTVVGRTLPPNVLVMGNPLRLIRSNYDNSVEIYGRGANSPIQPTAEAALVPELTEPADAH